jgi:hypothetical protein
LALAAGVSCFLNMYLRAKSLNYPAGARRPEGLLDAGMTKQKS